MAAYCKVPDCGFATGEPIPDIAGCLMTWHVYEEHPDIWRRIAGDRPPADPDPRVPLTRMIMALAHGGN
jgi:hypothetical protein